MTQCASKLGRLSHLRKKSSLQILETMVTIPKTDRAVPMGNGRGGPLSSPSSSVGHMAIEQEQGSRVGMTWGPQVTDPCKGACEAPLGKLAVNTLRRNNMPLWARIIIQSYNVFGTNMTPFRSIFTPILVFKHRILSLCESKCLQRPPERCGSQGQQYKDHYFSESCTKSPLNDSIVTSCQCYLPYTK